MILRDQYTLKDIMCVFDSEKAAKIMNEHKFDYAEAGVSDELDTIEILDGVVVIESGARLRSLRSHPILRLYREGEEGWTPTERTFYCYKRFRVTRKTTYDEWELHEEIPLNIKKEDEKK